MSSNDPRESGALDDESYHEIVETNRKQGLVFDTTAIVNGQSVEFYKNGKRVKVVHVLGVHPITPRKGKAR